VGRRLVDESLRRAHMDGLHRVYAIIHPENRSSLSLYRGAGFVVVGSWRFLRVAGLRWVRWLAVTGGDGPTSRPSGSASAGGGR
jgi:RimJ/RimL family protein N-acetyltransferase